MTDYAISARGVAKQYDLGTRDTPYETFREAVTSALLTPFKRFRQLSGAADEHAKFWALQDVDLDVKHGEVLGIIGRNGAGKSTLLKIIGRITEPTKGRITLKGRVASLLEVGTGFHPELTGRENIFLNGAILGMTRAEIRRKFDQIVAFADVEKFLDTPVKRYSSGMHVRLAFAVAAHLEPEIMLVDEVLAVGDIQFQRKCLDRMRGLAGGQTTIIFVSHNMAAIHALCNRCLLLDAGRSVKIGPTTDVATQYLQHHAPTQHFVRKHPLPKKACVTEADVRIGAISPELPGTLLQAKLKLWSPEKMKIAVQFRIKDPLGSNIAFASLGQFNPEDLLQLQAGEATLNVAIPIDQIAQGEYSLDIVLVIPMVALVDSVDDCIRFSVDRAPRPGHLRALQQSWGYGCVELPIHFAEAAIQVSSQHSLIEHSVTY